LLIDAHDLEVLLGEFEEEGIEKIRKIHEMRVLATGGITTDCIWMV
jgi:hypothetical protein